MTVLTCFQSIVPAGVPQNVEAEAVSASSIVISWQPPSPELQNGIITAYNITVLEVETGDVFTYETHGSDIIFIVNSLHPYYWYNCSVAAYTIGQGPSSFAVVRTHAQGKYNNEYFTYFRNKFSVRTESTDVPQDITVLPLDSFTVNMSWNPPPPEHHNGIIVGYTVQVVGVFDDSERELSTSELHTTVTNLHPFYTYKFSVAAVTIAGGPFSNPVIVQMPEASELPYLLL